VACKVLNSRDDEEVKTFTEEAELMKKFSHPNIVSLLGKKWDNYLNLNVNSLLCI